MFKTIANAWKIPDLRKKMLFTLFIVFIFRVGSVIPVPFLDVHALKQLTEGLSGGESMLAYFDLFSGGTLRNVRYPVHQLFNYHAAPVSSYPAP